MTRLTEIKKELEESNLFTPEMCDELARLKARHEKSKNLNSLLLDQNKKKIKIIHKIFV